MSTRDLRRNLGRLLGFSAMVVASGCSLTLDFAAQCSTASDCDPNAACVDGTCVPTTPDADSGVDLDQSVPDGAVPDMQLADMQLADQGVAADAAPDGMVPDMATPDAGPPMLALTEICHSVHGVPLEEALADTTILFGLMMPSTGDLGELGPPIGQAARLAADEINQTGGVLGRRFGLVECDTGTDETQAVEAAQWLVDVAQVPAIIGPAASSATIRVFNDVALTAETLVISPSSTSPAITDALDDNLLWRTAPSDAIQGSAIAAHLLAQNYEKVAVINRDDTYGNGLQAAIRRPLCDAGRCGEAQYFTRSYDPDDLSSQTGVMFALDDFEPDIVVLAAFVDDGISFLNLAEQAGVGPFILSDGAQDPALTERVSSRAILDALIGTAPSSPGGQTFMDFANRYDNKWGSQPGVFNAQAYDAMYLLGFAAGAILDDQPITGPNLAVALGRMSSGPSVLVGSENWNRGLAVLRNAQMGSIDFSGASGPLNFDANGEAPADIEAWRLDVEAGRVRSLGVIYTADGVYTDVTASPEKDAP